MIWVNSVIQGVLLGGQYALFACGLSLMFGVMGIINLAHGDLAILGAFTVLFLSDTLGITPFLALPAAVVIALLVGYPLHRLLLHPALRGGPLIPLLATFGLAIVLQNVMLEGFSADTRSLDAGVLTAASWRITDQIAVPVFGLVTFGAALCLLAGLHLFLHKVPAGRRMRATADSADTAELVGIDSTRVYALATAIALATATVAGAFFGMRSTFDPLAGPTQLIFGFEAVVIGGIGSLRGTIIGGITLGVAQTVGAQIDPRYAILAGHLVFLAVLGARAGRVLVVRTQAG